MECQHTETMWETRHGRIQRFCLQCSEVLSIEPDESSFEPRDIKTFDQG